MDIILYSGGMDSYIGDLYLREKKYNNTFGKVLTPLYVDYNGSACKKEKRLVKQLHPYTQVMENVLDLNGREHGEDNFLFGRNMFFCLLAAPMTEKYIYLCGLANSLISDNTRSFYEKASIVLSEIKQAPVKVTSPFTHMEKEEVVDWYIEQGHTLFDLLTTTSSCYYSDSMFCGECLGCFNFYCGIFKHLIQNRWLSVEYRFTNKLLVKNELTAANDGYRSPIRTETIRSIAHEMGIV